MAAVFWSRLTIGVPNLKRERRKAMPASFCDRPARLLRALHATVVISVVVFAIYAYVPPFVRLFLAFGPDLPLSSAILLSAYPFAFALPMATAAFAVMLNPGSRWSRAFVPCVYIVSVGLACFVVWALHAPALMLSAQ